MAFDDALDGEAEDEDEETLQLKLQEIQARLKLKKLQSARAKTEDASHSRPPAAPMSPQKRLLTNTAPRSQSREAVQVPASPVRKANAEPPPQTSPQRVLLGIDKGLTAKDVSLKRAPSLRRNPDSQQQPGGYLHRSKSQGLFTAQTEQQRREEPVRPLSFNERLAAARTQEADRHLKRERVRQVRTKAFGIGRQEMEEYKSKAVDLPEQPDAPAEQFSREDILTGQRTAPSNTALPRSQTAPDLRTGAGMDDSLEEQTTRKARGKKKAPDEVSEAEASAFEPYSTLHLKRRNVPHTVLTRHFTGKKIMTMKDLLREVKSPDYELPDYEQDIVFLAIVAKRSEPRVHKTHGDKNGLKQPDRGKYMVVTLVDLKFELELFLFDTGFERYWKVGEGTVLAILNPTIMPPAKGRQDTGRFSIVINSDEDKVIEVGMARDLGFCKSVKKDGTTCMSWVNAKRTEFCEYHTNEAIVKARGARVELNSWDRLGPGGGRRPRVIDVNLDKKHTNYDRGSHSHWFASRTMSAAELIDGASAFADRQEKKEGLQRRLIAQERERGIADRLGKLGNGAGKLYMKESDAARTASGAKKGSVIPVAGCADGTNPTPTDDASRLDAAALELLAPRPKGRVIELGPAKRKRPDSVASSSAGGKPGGGLGWGGSLSSKLSRMKEGEKLQPPTAEGGNPTSASSSLSSTDRPPVRKKTRFVTDKGIREAGRESLGDALPVKRGMVTLDDDDDDDDLVILR